MEPGRGRVEAALRALGPVIVFFLVLDALITLALEVLFLPTYVGATVVPVSGVLAGVVNVLLVMGVRTVSHRMVIMTLPIVAWAFGFLISASTGPGGDILLGSNWRTVLLLFCGLVPPLLYIYVRVNANLFSRDRPAPGGGKPRPRTR
ncbi:hypothetical protein [Nocardia callitridis]|uniref:hypothetical protein n=1 Tax=Nocardia callitridis TaxID=648753 RepID=UPI0031E516EE